MKIRIECNVMHRYDLKTHPYNFLIWNNRVSTKPRRYCEATVLKAKFFIGK